MKLITAIRKAREIEHCYIAKDADGKWNAYREKPVFNTDINEGEWDDGEDWFCLPDVDVTVSTADSLIDVREILCE